MCHVPVGDVLAVCYGDDIADFAGTEEFVQEKKEISVAEHVTNDEHAIGRLGSHHEARAVDRCCGHGFFEEHMIPEGQSCQRWFHMHCILGADECGLGELAVGKEFVITAITAISRDVVQVSDFCTSYGIWFSDGDDACFVGVMLCVGSIRICTARTSTNKNKSYGGHVLLLSICQTYTHSNPKIPHKISPHDGGGIIWGTVRRGCGRFGTCSEALMPFE